MKRQETALLDLIAEVAAWFVQRGRGHEATCTCRDCIVINLSIPVTVAIASDYYSTIAK
jgi:hypothetical protein